MDWYGGPTVLEHLETVPVSHDLAHCHARLPVQYVIRPQSADHPDYRGYAGQIAAGTFRVGDAGDLATCLRSLAADRGALLALQRGITPPRTMDAVAGDIEALYEDLVAARGRGGAGEEG